MSFVVIVILVLLALMVSFLIMGIINCCMMSVEESRREKRK